MEEEIPPRRNRSVNWHFSRRKDDKKGVDSRNWMWATWAGYVNALGERFRDGWVLVQDGKAEN
ncbi:hypothetical protein ANO14919_131230 [Xylariales sp. No.14919]|nr:hypothetical protein ANO14919_131230 [Xylariales sp. No.14919]